MPQLQGIHVALIALGVVALVIVLYVKYGESLGDPNTSLRICYKTMDSHSEVIAGTVTHVSRYYLHSDGYTLSVSRKQWEMVSVGDMHTGPWVADECTID